MATLWSGKIAVLVTSLDEGALPTQVMPKHYRADSENVLDALKNHRGWICNANPKSIERYREQDSNLHELAHLILNQARLPIPPSRHAGRTLGGPGARSKDTMRQVRKKRSRGIRRGSAQVARLSGHARAALLHNGTWGNWRETLRRMPRHRMPGGLLSNTHGNPRIR